MPGSRRHFPGAATHHVDSVLKGVGRNRFGYRDDVQAFTERKGLEPARGIKEVADVQLRCERRARVAAMLSAGVRRCSASSSPCARAEMAWLTSSSRCRS